MTDEAILPPTHEQEHPGATVFFKAGTRFSAEDMLTYAEQSEKPFSEVAHKIDLILTGPHASAVFPREIEPFLAGKLSQRLQYDYSDITTDPLARAWAQSDPRVVYIANPVSRLIFDQNRPKPRDVAGMLRSFFDRLHQKEACADVGFSGVDTVRAVTFGNVPLLSEPTSASAYEALAAVLSTVAEGTSLAYAAARDSVIEQVIEAKTRHLHEIDLATVSHRDLQSATMLHVQSVHDTMNATATPDGAVATARAKRDQLPWLVELGNRGNRQGSARVPSKPGFLAPSDPLTIPGSELRDIAKALCTAFGVNDAEFDGAISINAPYIGAWEVQHMARLVRSLLPQASAMRADGNCLSLRAGVYQSEYLRETLLGARAVKVLQTPGTDWPSADKNALQSFAAKLNASQDILRCRVALQI
jgi:hypothetical protein